MPVARNCATAAAERVARLEERRERLLVQHVEAEAREAVAVVEDAHVRREVADGRGDHAGHAHDHAHVLVGELADRVARRVDVLLDVVLAGEDDERLLDRQVVRDAAVVVHRVDPDRRVVGRAVVLRARERGARAREVGHRLRLRHVLAVDPEQHRPVVLHLGVAVPVDRLDRDDLQPLDVGLAHEAQRRAAALGHVVIGLLPREVEELHVVARDRARVRARDLRVAVRQRDGRDVARERERAAEEVLALLDRGEEVRLLAPHAPVERVARVVVEPLVGERAPREDVRHAAHRRRHRVHDGHLDRRARAAQPGGVGDERRRLGRD